MIAVAAAALLIFADIAGLSIMTARAGRHRSTREPAQ